MALDTADLNALVAEASTILDAAANQNVVLPSLCGQGACGTCVATITSGDYVQGPISPDAMGPMVRMAR